MNTGNGTRDPAVLVLFRTSDALGVDRRSHSGRVHGGEWRREVAPFPSLYSVRFDNVEGAQAIEYVVVFLPLICEAVFELII